MFSLLIAWMGYERQGKETLGFLRNMLFIFLISMTIVAYTAYTAYDLMAQTRQETELQECTKHAQDDLSSCVGMSESVRTTCDPDRHKSEKDWSLGKCLEEVNAVHYSCAGSVSQEEKSCNIAAKHEQEDKYKDCFKRGAKDIFASRNNFNSKTSGCLSVQYTKQEVLNGCIDRAKDEFNRSLEKALQDQSSCAESK